MLQNIFLDLTGRYSSDKKLQSDFWNEIVGHYSSSDRFYHNLNHLENIIEQLNNVRSQLKNYDSLLFAVFYHDIIYDVRRNDNEEQSARFAEEKMILLSVPKPVLTHCIEHILATKAHNAGSLPDTDYFTDADLSILGHLPEIYHQYALDIRKEYAMYPDDVYFPGRQKVLNHFLKMDSVFKTEAFIQMFESQARQNLQTELLTLCSNLPLS